MAQTGGSHLGMVDDEEPNKLLQAIHYLVRCVGEHCQGAR
jgi:hypothetical protein